MPRCGEYKFTYEKQEKFLAMLREGNFRSTAAKAVGISRVTAYNWIREDAVFRRQVEAAEAEAESAAVQTFKGKSPGDYLARRFVSRWKEPEKRVAFRGKIEAMSDTELNAYISELEQKRNKQ